MVTYPSQGYRPFPQSIWSLHKHLNRHQSEDLHGHEICHIRPPQKIKTLINTNDY